MSEVLPSDTALYRELRARLRHDRPAGRVIVAVDGLDAPRTRAFADGLVAALAEDGSAVLAADVAAFPARAADAAAWGTDVETMRGELIEPFLAGRAEPDIAVRTAIDADPVTVPADAVLVISGPGALQPAIRGSIAFGIWTQTDPESLAERPGHSSEQPMTDDEFRYVRDTAPLRAASALIDVTDTRAPVEFYRDFC